MVKTAEQLLAKLDRPPAAHNWALCNHQRRDRTTNALVNLALGFPTRSYQWAMKVIQIAIADQRSSVEAIKLLSAQCPASQWEHNLDFLNAFLAYSEERQFSGFPVLDEFCGFFMAGPAVAVPVRPTIIIREGGLLKPIFVIPWAGNNLGFYQRRLLSSIYEDAIFSLTDFRNSPGETLFFPVNGYGTRIADRWHRGTYERLTQSELTEQVERFMRAREEARLMIPIRLQEQADRRAARAASRTSRPDPRTSEGA